jgi:hypothetical protein
VVLPHRWDWNRAPLLLETERARILTAATKIKLTRTTLNRAAKHVVIHPHIGIGVIELTQCAGGGHLCDPV